MYPSRTKIAEIEKMTPVDPEIGLVSCRRCGSPLVEDDCPNCSSRFDRCEDCDEMLPIFNGKCSKCRLLAKRRADKKRKWGDRMGGCADFFSRNGLCMTMCFCAVILVVIATAMLIPLVVTVERDIENIVKGIQGGVEPVIDEGSVVFREMGRNAASALKMLEVPLNITEEIEEELVDVEEAVVEAVKNPSEVFVAYNRIAGTTITCEDGSVHNFVPSPAAPGVVINPHMQCKVRKTHVRTMPLRQHVAEQKKRARDVVAGKHPLASAIRAMAEN